MVIVLLRRRLFLLVRLDQCRQNHHRVYSRCRLCVRHSLVRLVDQSVFHKWGAGQSRSIAIMSGVSSLFYTICLSSRLKVIVPS